MEARATLLPQLPRALAGLIMDYRQARPPSLVDDRVVGGGRVAPISIGVYIYILQEAITEATGLDGAASLVWLIFQYEGTFWYDMLTEAERRVLWEFTTEEAFPMHLIEIDLIAKGPYIHRPTPLIGGQGMLLDSMYSDFYNSSRSGKVPRGCFFCLDQQHIWFHVAFTKSFSHD